jgi:NAD(P)H-hydrate repair Nnr-like enzyme with NAD(P)H-hydrate dehydratase domain
MRALAEQHTGDVYVVLTRNQVEFGRLFGGEANDWALSMIRQLQATGYYKVVFENGDSIVLLRPTGGPS